MPTSEPEDEWVWEVREAWMCPGIEHCTLPQGVHHRTEVGWTHLSEEAFGTEILVTYRVGIIAPPEREPWVPPVDPVRRETR